MSPATPPFPAPHRAADFAAGVRLRVGMRGDAGAAGGGGRRGARAGVEPAPRVWRAAVRPAIWHVERHHASATRTDVRLALHLTINGAGRGRTAAPPLTHVLPARSGQPGAAISRADDSAQAPPGSIAMILAMAPHAPRRDGALRGMPRAYPSRGAAQTASRPHTPTRVPLVHRATETVSRPPAASMTGVAPQSPAPMTALRFEDPRGAPAPASVPLTAADLPRVVDRVMGELDRRIVAARERKGWTA